MISATSQQSRFHTETLDAAAFSKDIDLKQVNISVGQRELLVDCHLKLFSGTRYCLIGRNGTGKSTLLKSLGFSLLIGLPHHIRALYVDQLEGEDVEKSVLQLVLQSDVRSDELMAQTEALAASLETGTPEDIVQMQNMEMYALQTLRQLRVDHLKQRLQHATKIATHRSGQRGLAARQIQVALENELDQAVASQHDAAAENELAGAMDEAQQLLDLLYEELDARDADGAESRARTILTGLGITQQQQDAPLAQLSGGWRMRVALAQALFLKPDLLLLDEPTNHLDLQATLWLSTYLQQLEGVTLLVVSHDRAFLNAVAQQTILVKNCQLLYYTGNYDTYVQARDEKREDLEKKAAALEKKKAHIEKTIADGIKNARKTGDDNKLNMVASRKKKLERLGMEKNDKGHRFRIQRDLIGYHTGRRAEINRDIEEAAVVFTFPKTVPLRSKGSLLQLEDVSYGYPGAASRVLQHVTLNVQPGERVALVGANGQGKSTLVKLITGELTPVTGNVTLHREAVLGVFSQHNVEDMLQAAGATSQHAAAGSREAQLSGQEGKRNRGASAKDTDAAVPYLTAVSWLHQQHPNKPESDLCALLGLFGIRGDVMQQPLQSLSGGQAVRVALVNSVARAPHFLILDEVSNHLDMDTVEGLADALKSYSGALLLVSHDRWLVDQVAQRVYVVGDGGVKLLEGGVEEYVRMLTHPLKKNSSVPAKSFRQQAREAKQAARAQPTA